MSDLEDRLGGRLSLLDPRRLDKPAKALYDRISETAVTWAEGAGFESKTADGRLIGPFNATLLSPEICGSFLALQKTEETHTTLSERVRQVVILSVGSVWQAPYELYAHSAVARKAGLDEATIRALAADEPSETLGGDERIAREFTRQLVAERRVDGEVYEAARAVFGERGLVDMIVLAGCYQVVCSLLEAFEVPAPKPA